MRLTKYPHVEHAQIQEPASQEIVPTTQLFPPEQISDPVNNTPNFTAPRESNFTAGSAVLIPIPF
jgi:hypothetical protein